jgi:ornithine cyclodeaminase/alanine dehydrogenase-like protein (mu-crystallin family)
VTSPLPYLDADAVSAVPWTDAVDALEQALVDGLDLDASGTRTVVDVDRGQLLLMPAETSSGTGIKLATVAPDNPARGMPRIQAVYLLIEPVTLTPRAMLDGTALTNLRTPAVSGLAVRHLARSDAHRLVVFGSGPQALGHILAIRAVRPVEAVTVVGRDPGGAQALADRASAVGLSVCVGRADAVEDADIVVCATTAGEPLFRGDLVSEQACVVAIGSHEPNRRELDGTLMRRAGSAGAVVVETPATALREAGDVVLAIEEEALSPDQLVGLADVVRRDVRPDGPTVFKSVGMGWEDLVVAQTVWHRQADADAAQ